MQPSLRATQMWLSELMAECSRDNEESTERTLLAAVDSVVFFINKQTLINCGTLYKANIRPWPMAGDSSYLPSWYPRRALHCPCPRWWDGVRTATAGAPAVRARGTCVPAAVPKDRVSYTASPISDAREERSIHSTTSNVSSSLKQIQISR